MAKQSIESLREQIGACRDEMAAIAGAPLPLAEAEAHMRQLLDTVAQAYTPPVVEIFARDPDPQPAALSVLLPDPRFDVPATFVFWASVLDRDRLLAIWAERLRAAYASDQSLANPVSLAERPARLQDAARRLRELELDEERFIVEVEARGIVIDRRPDAEPSVLFDPSLLALEALPAAS